jgi:hypothetical protein
MKSVKIIDLQGNVHETSVGQVSHLMEKIEQSVKLKKAETISEDSFIIYLNDGTKVNFNSNKGEIFFDIQNFGIGQIFCTLNEEECQFIKNLITEKV